MIHTILALLLLTTPAHGQISAIEKARDAYATCVELAAMDEYVSMTGAVGAAMVERAISACVTEENGLVSVTALSLSPFGDRVLKAQAMVAQFRAALKVKIMKELTNNMERSPFGDSANAPRHR
jgi:hypothetical protein